MSLLKKLYYRIRFLWPVWFYILNRKAYAYWENHKKQTSFLQEHIISTLKKDGIAFTRIDELFGSSFFQQLKEFTDRKLSREEIVGKIKSQKESLVEKIEGGGLKKREKDFFVWLWSQEEHEPLDTANPFIKMILDEKIIQIVGGYLNFAPRLSIFSLILTLVMPPGSKAYLSQRWHRDPDDKKLIKMFVYLTDVFDEESGPFRYVKRSHFGSKWRHLFPQKPPAGNYPPEGALEKRIPQENFVTCFGKAGTVIFCDTSGFHKGGFCTEKERIMFTSAYITDGSPYPLYHEISKSMDIKTFPPLVRYALHKE